MTQVRLSCARCSVDFPNDPKVFNIGDQYMFGPAFLVAPVTEQGRESREVYLPAGSEWYNYWTNEKLAGGQTVTVAAPIDVIPLFVRAGSIVPMGVDISSTATPQSLKEIRSIRARALEFTLSTTTMACPTTMRKESGARPRLKWDDKLGQLSAEGDKRGQSVRS